MENPRNCKTVKMECSGQPIDVYVNVYLLYVCYFVPPISCHLPDPGSWSLETPQVEEFSMNDDLIRLDLDFVWGQCGTGLGYRAKKTLKGGRTLFH